MAKVFRPRGRRLALESGAPVVPVAIHGSSGAHDWRRLRFPRVSVSYGEPLSFEVEPEPSRERQQEAAGEIFGRVRGLYRELEGGA